MKIQLIKLLAKYLNSTLIIFLVLIFIQSCAFSPGMKPINPYSNIYDNLDLKFHNLEKIDLSLLPSQSEKNQIDESNLEKIVQNNFYRYLIGKGDVLNISVTDVDDIKGEFKVAEDGTINLPYVGKLLIADLTKLEVEDLLTKTLSEFYQNPEVIFEIKDFKSRYAYITGEVQKPQSILLTEKEINIVDAILLAGYIKDQKSYDKKALLRRNNEIFTIDLYKLMNEIEIKYNIFLREDDILHIQRKSEDKVYVFGEANQGTYSLFDNATLTKLLSTINVNQVTSNMNKVFVIREDLSNPNSGDIYELNAKNPQALLLANNFNLIAGDVVFISPAPIVRWNRVISLITPQSGIFTTYRDINQIVDSEFTSGTN